MDVFTHATILGADETLETLTITYGRILTLSLVFFGMQNMFQTLLITDERPQFGFLFIVAAIIILSFHP